MKSRSTVIAAAAVLIAGILPAQTAYKIDPAHSSAQFAVKHMMVSNVRGEFSNVTGTVLYDPSDLSTSSVDASIDIATLTTREPDRDKHLKSPDFFDVDKFPKMTFKSTEFVKQDGGLKIKGNLTLHGVTKPVVLTVDGPSPETKDPWGNMRRGVSATTTLNRQDFGLVWNKNLDGGGVLVGDQVNVTIDLEGVRQK